MSLPTHGYARTPQPAPPRTRRPNIKTFSSYPAHGHAPAPPPPRMSSRPTSQIYGGIGNVPIFIPPQAPSAPTSPTFSSSSSQGMSSHSTDSGGPVAHWAMRIFDGRHSSTPFHTLGDATECFGRDEPQVMKKLGDDGFEKVIELPLEATNVWLRLYCRFGDLRARLLFLTIAPDGSPLRYCFPLTGLKIIRKDSCLQLCRVNRKDGRFDLWARLRFTLYERTC